jgi:hypothetical protein
MRIASAGVLALAVLAGVAIVATALLKLNLGVHSDVCQSGDEIEASVRSALEDRAMAFTKAILTGKSAEAYSMMSDAVRAASPEDKFDAAIDAGVRRAGRLQGLRIGQTYYVVSTGAGPDGRTMCGSVADDKQVLVAVKPGLDQGHVVVYAKAHNNDWAFTFWLLPKGKDWQIQFFHLSPATMVGLTPEELLQRARRERDSGHMFNAAMLYAGVQGTSDYGPAFQPAIVQSLRRDLHAFRAPAELSGPPPFDWKMGGTDYSVLKVTIIGVAGKLGLIFLLPQKSWSGEDDAAKFNRAFLTAFIAAHPDYQRSFSFLVARALKPDGSGDFGTVYEIGKGFR